MIGAQRRQQIYEYTLQRGGVSVTELAREFDVAASTVRQDLQLLDQEGKLVRSHGGAVVKDATIARVPYSATRDKQLLQKALIGEAALAYLPSSGTIFIGAGTTTYELAIRIPADSQLQVVTNAPKVATHLSTTVSIPVHLLGGKMRADSCSTNCILDPALDVLYWDTAFIGMPAIDPVRGISTVDHDAALMEKKIIEHSARSVALCDSSKFNRFSYATVGPVSLVDIVITDSGINSEVLDALERQGVQTVVVGLPSDSGVFQGLVP